MPIQGLIDTRPRPEQAQDPLFPKTDPLLRRRELTPEEREDVAAFLEAL